MKNSRNATLWKITGLIAIGLLIATLILAYQANNLPIKSITGKLTSPNPTVYLRAEPSGSSEIVTILERGSIVQIINTDQNQNIQWIKIDTGHFTGWIPETNIVIESK